MKDAVYPNPSQSPASGKTQRDVAPRVRALLRRATDLLFLVRPVLLGPVWAIYGAGALVAGGRPGWDLLFVSLLVSGVYVHNQLVDVDTDRANRKLFLIGDEHVSRSAAWWVVALAWTAALLWAATEGYRFFLYLAALALGLAYNALPVPWKARPWLGLFANTAAHGPVTFLAGYTAAGGGWHQGAIASLPYAFAVGAVYLATTIVDHRGDWKSGKVTMAVRYGERATAWMIGSLVLVSVLLADAVDDPWMAVAAAVSAPVALVLALYPVPKAAQVMAKVAVLALAFCVALRWPPLFLLAAATFFGARLYYRWRFGVRYPTFGAEQP